ncbi:extracellular solute-binding protein [Pseudokineococcus lusitanus]|uniref:Iron(III) transport system substrate-binding protein n=1 Tax=Pseudokineococcus lusitanus TaxID=763993 RepID=A0A3N1HR25_9ACTN|nr:extracellular solute-binding protein [Pseudokineococcus lusitanus]ROP44963.1 iron(III) transport system substrate-binding protein [Pseudokineococcus lusitanus]
MTWRRTAAAVVAGTTTALALVACGEEGAGVDGAAEPGATTATACTAGEPTYGETDEEVAAQEVDDEALVVYSGRNEDLVGPALEQFTASTGIEVSVRYGGTPGITAQLLEEGDASPADVVITQDAGAFGALHQAGCLAPLPAATTERVAEEFRADGGDWAPLTGRARVVSYNTDLVTPDEVPTTLEELVDPAVASRLGVAPTNASFLAFVTAVRVLEGDEAAEDLLTGLAEGGAQTFEGNGDLVEAVADGRVDMGLLNHYYLYELQAERGADQVPVVNAYAEDGGPLSLVNVSGAAVHTSTDRADDALALVDHLLSDEAQAYFAQETNEYPMVDGAPEPADAPQLADVRAPALDLDDLASLRETQALVDASGLS